MNHQFYENFVVVVVAVVVVVVASSSSTEILANSSYIKIFMQSCIYYITTGICNMIDPVATCMLFVDNVLLCSKKHWC